MKTIILTSGAILLAMNILFGLILSSYDPFNVAVSSGIIVVNTAILCMVNALHSKDGFRISLTLLFASLSIVEFLLSLFAGSHFKDNWYLIVLILLLGFEAIILVLTTVVSNRNKV